MYHIDLFQAQYSLARAQQSFKSLVQIHEKNGLYTCMKFKFICYNYFCFLVALLLVNGDIFYFLNVTCHLLGWFTPPKEDG